MARKIIDCFMRQPFSIADRDSDKEKYEPLRVDRKIEIRFFQSEEGLKANIIRDGTPHFINGNNIGQVSNDDHLYWLRTNLTPFYTARIHSSEEYDPISGGSNFQV
jgi:hypothetical protein